MRLLHQGWVGTVSVWMVSFAALGPIANDNSFPLESLEELAKENELSHRRLRSIRCEYDVEGRIAAEGRSPFVSKSMRHLHHAAKGNHEFRLRLDNWDGKRKVVDHYFADDVIREQSIARAFDPV